MELYCKTIILYSVLRSTLSAVSAHIPIELIGIIAKCIDSSCECYW